MLVDWKRRITDSAIKWQLLINMLQQVLPSDDMQKLYTNLMALNNQPNFDSIVLPDSVD